MHQPVPAGWLHSCMQDAPQVLSGALHACAELGQREVMAWLGCPSGDDPKQGLHGVWELP